MLAGRKVWEVLPQELGGKGVAVCRMLEELPRPTLSIFIGDDVSDERAFAALRGELTVRVGRPRRTRAHFRLRNPIEVVVSRKAGDGDDRQDPGWPGQQPPPRASEQEAGPGLRGAQE